MATTTTTVLGLTKPTPGSKEPFSTAQVNTNWDKIDAAIGAKVTKTGSATTIVNTTSEGILDAGLNIPANSAAQGSAYKLVLFGTFGNVVTTTPTITFRLRLGGLTGTQLGANIVVTTNAVAQTNQPWRAEVELVCQTTGAAGTWHASFKVDIALGNATVVDSPQITTTATPVVVDTTVSKDLVVTAQWSAANASNTISGRSGYAHRVSNT